IARFASPQSPCPDVQSAPRGPWATAGWCFDPDAADGQPAARAAHDPRLLDRLQGQYLFISLDERSGRLWAAGDRLGLFPIYVAQQDGLAWISTSALALAAALGSSLDTYAIRALFLGDAIRSPRSAFAGIHRLCMGEQAIAADGRLTVERVWSP